MPKKPLTFEQAMRKAELLYVGDKGRMLWLIEKATNKAERHYESLLAAWESLQILLRLIRSCLAGKYCASAASILMAVAAVIYFVSPFDLIPDAVPVLGLIDDASVIAFVARANIGVISRFRKWEVSL
jgi:uncharacterized membrane protein YkvA (DUF1232 family)